MEEEGIFERCEAVLFIWFYLNGFQESWNVLNIPIFYMFKKSCASYMVEISMPLVFTWQDAILFRDWADLNRDTTHS